jgi:pectinesterase inhibitor-like protein
MKGCNEPTYTPEFFHGISSNSLFVLSSCCSWSMTSTMSPWPWCYSTSAREMRRGAKSEYGSCIKTMEADRASTTADTHGLAVIAAWITRATTKATADKIEAALWANETSPVWQTCLSACAVEYTATVRRLGLGTRVAVGLAGGSARELADSQEMLAKAYNVLVMCDTQFANVRLASLPRRPA